MAADLELPPEVAAPGFAVIETFGWDGARFPRIWAHMDRLGRTCAGFGISLDPGDVLVRLDALPLAGPARIRVTVARDGAVAVSHAPLGPADAVWRVAVAHERLASGNPWLRVKTTERGLYDRARAALPEGVAEMIFLNERGEVCEGAITTVFFDAGAGLCTPPLLCGVLPGILRAEQVAAGCREQVLRGDALGDVRLWVGNSLRGMIPALLDRGR